MAAIVCTAPAFAAETFTIKDIRVEGLERVEPDTVFAYMPVKIGDTFTDIVVVVDKLQFSAVLADKKTSLGTYGIRHDDYNLVSFDCAYE